VDLPIPVSARTTNGRISGNDLSQDIDSETWKVDIEVSAAGLATTSGIGMHPDAHVSKDKFDEITLPRFIDYAVLDSKHPEFFAPEFAVDVVPTAKLNKWHFDLRSNLKGEQVELKWDHHALQGSRSALILVDLMDNTWTDMKLTGQLTLTHREDRQLSIMYSRSGDISPDVTMLGDAYPNAFVDEVQIPVLFSANDRSVRVEVFDMIGRKVKVLNETFPKPGIHSMYWNGKDDHGNTVSGGVYLYRLVNSNAAKRMVKQ
jgi:hypothetical protein